jgi:hypothetical protein
LTFTSNLKALSERLQSYSSKAGCKRAPLHQHNSAQAFVEAKWGKSHKASEDVAEVAMVVLE